MIQSQCHDELVEDLESSELWPTFTGQYYSAESVENSLDGRAQAFNAQTCYHNTCLSVYLGYWCILSCTTILHARQGAKDVTPSSSFNCQR